MAANIAQKRIDNHSKQIAVLTEQQIEQYKLLTEMHKNLSPEFFDQHKMMYQFLIVGNGVTSLKAWRGEVDKERIETKEALKDKRGEWRKWIYFFVGTVTAYVMAGLR